MSGIYLSGPSPYDTFPVLEDANLVFPVYFGKRVAMVLSVPHAAQSELAAIVEGRVDVAARVWEMEDAAFITWRFASAGGSDLYVRAPVHVLLMDILLEEYDPNDILGLGEYRDVVLFVQDERPHLCASRIVQMPQAVSELLAPVLTRQVAHRRLPRQELRDRVEASVNRYLELYPSPEEDFASAPVKGCAS